MKAAQRATFDARFPSTPAWRRSLVRPRPGTAVAGRCGLLRRDDGLIPSAHQAPNGHIVDITDLGWVVDFDPHRDGRVVYRFHVGDPGGTCAVEWLPNGLYLVALSGHGKVMEVDRSGKPVWSLKVAGAHPALRLPSGRLLVVSMSTKRVAEMDHSGKVFWEKKTRGRPWRVHRR
jgi:hypothetical protein